MRDRLGEPDSTLAGTQRCDFRPERRHLRGNGVEADMLVPGAHMEDAILAKEEAGHAASDRFDRIGRRPAERLAQAFEDEGDIGGKPAT